MHMQLCNDLMSHEVAISIHANAENFSTRAANSSVIRISV